MTVLVTGGAGYIGSHTTYALLDRGDKVVVLDNLSTGIRSLVGEKAVFVEGNVADQSLVARLIHEHGIDAVIHFAASVVVPESVAKPLAYYANNVVASRALIEVCVEQGVRQFIFSSTAAVYTEDAPQPLVEDARKAPISPYARSKLMTEWILEDASRAYDFRHIVLRYFNVAGADPRGRTGQSTPNATHLIKRACQVALGRVPIWTCWHRFPTPDGTGVRDYIHVADLADAHLLAPTRSRLGGIDKLQLRLWARLQRAPSDRRLGGCAGPQAAGEGRSAPARRSGGAYFGPHEAENHLELAAPARGFRRYHPLSSGMGAPVQSVTGLPLHKDAGGPISQRNCWGLLNCPLNYP